MGENNFTTSQCGRALLRLGFLLSNKRGGQHDKFLPPLIIANSLSSSQPHFIMVPRHRTLHCQLEIIAELRRMGGEGLVEKFRHEL